MLRTTLPLAFLLAVSLSAGCAGERPMADTVFENGKFYTVDGRSRWVDAVAVKDGRFIMVGDAVDVGEVTGPDTEIVDLEGRFVMPGLVDRDGGAGTGTIPAERHPELWAEIQGMVTATDGAIPLGDAIAAHTRDAASARIDPDVGSIQVGKHAEMIVLDRDPFRMPADSIATVEAVRIISGGVAPTP